VQHVQTHMEAVVAAATAIVATSQAVTMIGSENF
jgi:hypothetical protein